MGQFSPVKDLKRRVVGAKQLHPSLNLIELEILRMGLFDGGSLCLFLSVGVMRTHGLLSFRFKLFK